MSSTSSTSPVTSGEVSVADEIAAREQALDGIEERRCSPRADAPMAASLRALSGAEIPARLVDNISEGGLRLTAPIGFGVAVGQRYEVLLRGEGADTAGRDLVGEACYATVVRTEIMLGGGAGGDRVGVGMRFDTPIVL